MKFNLLSKTILLSYIAIISGFVVLTPTYVLSAPTKKKLEIIIGGDNFCKDNKDCAGETFCHMSSHICIACPKPFEWVGGTQCVCPKGTVPTVDGTDCVECLDDTNCRTLKGDTSWYCDTGSNVCINCPSPKEWHPETNTCECPASTYADGNTCLCDNKNKTLKDGLCQCQIEQKNCSSSDFMGEINCSCCPADKPVWNGASGKLADCKSCAEIDAIKPYYSPTLRTCEECLENGHCKNEAVCSSDNTCVCELTQADCTKTDFNMIDCLCCPTDKPVWDAEIQICKTCEEIDSTKPYYDATTHTCKECLEDNHCENEAVCSSDKTCICELTQADCTVTDFNMIDCICCPTDKPVYDKTSGMCKTCDEMHPEWAETGSTYDMATHQCWPYCKEQNVGLVMLVDRSGSTKTIYTATSSDGNKQKLSYAEGITQALQALKIPKKIKTVMYLNNNTTTQAIKKELEYGYNNQDAIDNAINYLDLGGSYISGNITTFKQALVDIKNNICPTGDKLIIMMWADGELSQTKTPLEDMMASCTNAKFYYVGPTDKYSIRNGYYSIKSLPSDYSNSLNEHMRQEGCVPRPEDEVVE